VSTSAHPRGYAVDRGGASRAPVRVAGLVAAGLVCTVALAACGQPTRSDDPIGPTVSVPVQPTIERDTPTVDAPDTTAPVTGGLFDASNSLVASSCKPTGGLWSFNGTVSNTDSVAHTFTVAVFIVRTADSSDVAGKEIDVTVAPGAKGDVAAKGFWRGPATGVECLTGVTVKDQ
jgi:hypothetical protein